MIDRRAGPWHPASDAHPFFLRVVMAVQPGKLIVVSGPSGAGKSTLVRRLLADCPLPLRLSVSATTRSPRPGEIDGREYNFLTHQEFARRRKAGEFLECREVFANGNWYGTLAETVSAGLQRGDWVILEIDVGGALEVFPRYSDAISFFIHPGSMEELERRLRGRGTETEEAIARRLAVAADEWTFRTRYHHEIVNDRLDRAVQEMCRLLRESKGAQGVCSTN